MKRYIILPNSGHPYKHIANIPHLEVGKPSPAQRGQVALNVLHNNGMLATLSFNTNEVREVQ